MTTTIDNNQRVFMVTDGIHSRFCNLSDIQTVGEWFRSHYKGEGYKLTYFHSWDCRMQRISRKHLNEMLDANRINYKVK